MLSPEDAALLELANADAGGEVITVTGSLIERRELTTPAPVSVVDRAELAASGLVNLGDVLRSLPSQSNAINIQYNNPGDGSTRVNLRGLGEARTLVLLNGRRIVPGGVGADASVDLNAIPLAMIERVEVLKDGASAVYGSDAIGGVVNIITRKDFTGQEATIYTGMAQHGAGGMVYDASFVAGVATPRDGIVVSAGYSEVTPMFAGERGFSRIDREFDYELREPYDSGSSATSGGFLVTDEDGDGVADAGNARWDDEVVGRCPSTECARDANGWRDFNFDGANNDYYNYQPDNYLVTPLRRITVMAEGHHQLGKRSRAFFEASYLNRNSAQALAPEPLFLDQIGVSISKDNAYNPYGRDIGFLRRRLNEVGYRQTEQEVDTFRIVTGLDGQLASDVPVVGDWKWEASFNYGRTRGSQINRGNLILSRLVAALGPSYTDDGDVLRCGTADAPGADDCVPLDVLGGAGSITPEMAKYLTYTGVSGGYNEQRTALVSAHGQLVKTRWGGDISLAVGADYRQEAGGFTPDPLTATGDTTGNATEPTDGSYDVAESFAELSIVPVAGKKWAKWVELDLAARGFRYSTFGSGVTWKAGGLFRTRGGLAFRGSYSTAFRAPAITELYSGNADSAEDGTDPCDTSAGPLEDPNTIAECAAEGIPETFQNPVSQVRTNVGGNPELDPETAKVLTAGIVYEPTFAKGLDVTLDYFNFAIDDAIQSIGTQVLLSNCYAQATPTDCDKIFRRPGTHVIDFVDDKITNVGGNATSGIDVALGYAHTTRHGRFRHQLEATRLLTYTETNSSRTLDGLGVYDLGAFPRWKATWSTEWADGRWGAGANIRYVGVMTECDGNLCNDGAPGRRIDRNTTGDVFGTYRLTSAAGETNFTVGVNNVLDTDPPTIYSGQLADSDASTYDYIGRFYYFRLAQTF